MIKKTLLWLMAAMAALEGLARSQARRLDEYLSPPAPSKLAYYENLPESPDLCFLGSSHAMCGFDDDVFRGQQVLGQRPRTVINMSVGGGGVGTWRVVRHIARRPPKLVIYGASIYDFNREAKFGVLELSLPDFLAYNRLRFRPELLWPWLVEGRLEPFLERHWAFYHYRLAARWALMDALRPWFGARLRANVFAVADNSRKLAAARRRITLQATGYPDMAAARTRDPVADADLVIARLSGQDFRFGAEDIVDGELDELLGRGVKLAIIDVPVTAAGRLAFPQEAWTRYSEHLSRAANERHLPLLAPTMGSCGLTDSDYQDSEHMLPEGARKFSLCVLRALSRSSRPGTS